MKQTSSDLVVERWSEDEVRLLAAAVASSVAWTEKEIASRAAGSEKVQDVLRRFFNEADEPASESHAFCSEPNSDSRP